jgi:hypothetical protein
MLYMELRGDHDSFQYLFCDNGRLSARHLHNWQHASSYPAFMISGLVDLLGLAVKLPDGTQQAFLSLAFGIEGFLMFLHKKHEELDALVHWLLGCSMVICSLFVALELRSPNNLLVSAGRAVATMQQGIWLCLIGKIMYAGGITWAHDYPGPIMFVPVVYCMFWLANALTVLLLYVGLSARHQRRMASEAQYTSLPLTKADLKRSRSLDAKMLEQHNLLPNMDESAAEESEEGSEFGAAPSLTVSSSLASTSGQDSLPVSTQPAKLESSGKKLWPPSFGAGKNAPAKKKSDHII